MITDDNPAVLKVVAALRTICAKLPGAEEYVMVHHPAFRVGKKPFVIAGLHADRKGTAVSINLGREAQHLLLDDKRFTRTPYIGQHGWVTIAHGDLRSSELASLVSESWRRVARRKQLAELDGATKTTATRISPKVAKSKGRAAKAKTRRAK
jgi:predicted DNA-binding protein (MmcQ/YjbR family)